MLEEQRREERAAERKAQRELVESRLWRAARFDEYHRLQRCGEKRQLCCTCCGTWLEIQQWCMRRYCPDCALRRSIELQRVYEPTVERMKWPLFLTLTLGGGENWELDEMISALRGGFRKMRRHKWFSDRVKGGVASVELAWAKRGWHAHLHALLECRWLAVTVAEPRPGMSKAAVKRAFKAAQKEIAAMWSDACGIDPSGIFVRRPTAGTTREVLKYSVKPASWKEEDMPVHDLLDAMKGMKMVAPWGTVRKLRRLVVADLEAVEPKAQCKCKEPSWRMV